MEKVLLVGVNSGRDAEFERSMEELENLAQACDLEVAARTAQNLSAVNTAFYIGSGKVEEVGRMAQMLEVQLIIFNVSLTPTQQRNLQKALDLPVWDRTGLILEIFGRRARTREARLQVESARLQYMLPRLVGMREALSRQGGGAGAGGGYGAGGGFSNRGAGETKLELDRRKIERRLAELRRGLEIQSLILAVQAADFTAADAQERWRQSLEPLRKLVEQMRQATGRDRVACDSAFHEALIQCSANRLFAVLQKAISSLCEAAIENVLTAATDARWQALVDCHEEIYQCLLSRDVQGGIAAIDRHYAEPAPEGLPPA